MPVYAYVAVNEKGREYSGRDEAISEAALEGRFKKMGHWIAEVKEVRPMMSGGPLGTKGGQAVSSRVLTEFFLQLSLQLRAGIPLFSALSNESVDSGNPKFRRTMMDLTERVQAGQSLSEALSMHPRVFPKLAVNLLKAGEASGKLAEACQQVRSYLEWQQRISADVKQALTYPMFVMVCAVLFVGLIFTLVIPKFSKLLIDLKVPLPTVTQVVMDISNFCVNNWLVGILSIVGTFVGFKVALKASDKFAYAVDAMKLKLPLIGNLAHMIGLSRFSQNLSLIYQSGIPLLEALALVQEVVGNRVLERAVADLRRAVSEGKQMHTAMGKHPVFSRLVLQMVAVGESTGSLGTALDNVAAYYDDVLPRQIKRMFSLLEPLMILGLIIFIGIIAMAVFLPIVSLISV